ncbi:MAG: DUF4112 domain-containing protein [Verrucomicrobiales bacterium]|nr:DUF4112 domain-containing protein [Verrucomicrobiales bacterium]
MPQAPDAAEPPRSLSTSKLSPASRKIAWVLDEFIRIPGTQFRFGLDPILGLIPGGGEILPSIIACFLLADARRHGLPFKLLLKMSGNVFINAAVGSIPLLGDAFSAYYKSNSRNYAMMQQFIDSHHGDQSGGSWWPLLFILFTLTAVTLLNIAIGLFFIAAITSIASGLSSH